MELVLTDDKATFYLELDMLHTRCNKAKHSLVYPKRSMSSAKWPANRLFGQVDCMQTGGLAQRESVNTCAFFTTDRLNPAFSVHPRPPVFPARRRETSVTQGVMLPPDRFGKDAHASAKGGNTTLKMLPTCSADCTLSDA